MRYYSNHPLVPLSAWRAIPWVRHVDARRGWAGMPEMHVWLPWWCPVKRRVREYIERNCWAGVCVVYHHAWLPWIRRER